MVVHRWRSLGSGSGGGVGCGTRPMCGSGLAQSKDDTAFLTLLALLVVKLALLGAEGGRDAHGEEGRQGGCTGKPTTGRINYKETNTSTRNE